MIKFLQYISDKYKKHNYENKCRGKPKKYKIGFEEILHRKKNIENGSLNSFRGCTVNHYNTQG